VRLSEGVEWGLHCTVLLAQVPAGAVLSRRALADRYGLPEAYLAKHLRALVAAGILRATPGPRGGYQLARPAGQVTVLDVLDAVEGTAAPFVCQEIRQQGSGAVPAEQCTRPCAVAAVMTQAHRAWRDSLRSVTVAELTGRVPRPVRDRIQRDFGGRPGFTGAGSAGAAPDRR
jgi:Rrf2 family protein